MGAPTTLTDLEPYVLSQTMARQCQTIPLLDKPIYASSHCEL